MTGGMAVFWLIRPGWSIRLGSWIFQARMDSGKRARICRITRGAAESKGWFCSRFSFSRFDLLNFGGGLVGGILLAGGDQFNQVEFLGDLVQEDSHDPL